MTEIIRLVGVIAAALAAMFMAIEKAWTLADRSKPKSRHEQAKKKK